MSRRVLLAGALLVALGATTLPSGAVTDFDPGTAARVSLSTMGAAPRFVTPFSTGPAASFDVGSGAVGFGDLRNDPQTAMSSTGRFVAFTTLANNLMDRPGNLLTTDSNGAMDVYLRDRDPDADGTYDTPGSVTTKRISLSTTGAQGNGDSFWPTMSTNGRFVTFVSQATNFVPPGVNECVATPELSASLAKPLCLGNAYLRDRDPDGDGIYDEVNAVTTSLVSIDTTGNRIRTAAACVPGTPPVCDVSPFGSLPASVSDDGRWVAFSTPAKMTPNDKNDCGPSDHPAICTDVFLRDMTLGTTTLLSSADDGTPGNDASVSRSPSPAPKAPAITPNGRFITFSSYASNLAPNDVNEAPDVFIRDRDPDGDGVFDEDTDLIFDEPGEYTMTRVAPPQRPTGRYKSYSPSISWDGRWVAYQAVGSNITIGEREVDLESRVFVYDRTTGANVDIGLSGLTTQAELRSYSPTISGNGRIIAFTGAIVLAHAEGIVPALSSFECQNLGIFCFGDQRADLDLRAVVLVHDRDVDANGTFDETDPGKTSTIRGSHGGLGLLDPADGDSYGPIVSGNGDLIGFISFASNLEDGGFFFPGGNGVANIFVYKRGVGLCIEVACVY